jgi:hypothetical protein
MAVARHLWRKADLKRSQACRRTKAVRRHAQARKAVRRRHRMLDLAGLGWSSPTRAPLSGIVPPPDQLLHLLLLHPTPPDVLRLLHWPSCYICCSSIPRRRTCYASFTGPAATSAAPPSPAAGRAAPPPSPTTSSHRCPWLAFGKETR